MLYIGGAIDDVFKNCVPLRFVDNKVNNQNTEKKKEPGRGYIHIFVHTSISRLETGI